MTGNDGAGGTETTNRGVSTGEPPVNSRQSAQMPRPRSRLWNHKGSSTGEADSLQNAINAFTVGCSLCMVYVPIPWSSPNAWITSQEQTFL